MHMNSFAPISMTGAPGSLWKCGTTCSAIVKALGQTLGYGLTLSARSRASINLETNGLVQDSRRLRHQRQLDLADELGAQPLGVCDARRDLLCGRAVRAVEHDPAHGEDCGDQQPQSIGLEQP